MRHGQAAHNPRAEVAREGGCSFDEFLRLMEEDDSYDAALTELGEDQASEAGRRGHVRLALRDVDMIASSPLSRALRTADLIFPPHTSPPSSSSALRSSSPFEGANNGTPKRICVEEFREINGRLLNAKRRLRVELERDFPHWDFSLIPRELMFDETPISLCLDYTSRPTCRSRRFALSHLAHDETWRPDAYESSDECGERGYHGLMWLMGQRERRILVVCHGGLLSHTLNNNAKVVLVDGRDTDDDNGEGTTTMRCTTKRFGNCEMREFVMTAWVSGDDDNVTDGEIESLDVRNNRDGFQPVITLEEVTMEISTDCISNDSGDTSG
jgi:broad specificity phosphatase PhoE